MKIFRCCKLNVLQWRIQPKYAICVVFLILHMWNLLHGLKDYSADLGYPMHPWIFPFLPGMQWEFTVIMTIFVFLICDAPFRSGQQRLVLLRTGKRQWIGGQLLYLLLASIFFVVLVWVLSWLFLLPNLEWAGDWGKAIQTAARTHGLGQYTAATLNVQFLKGITPVAGALWTGLMMVGICFLLGEVVLVCNLWGKRGLGTAIAMGLVLQHAVICGLSTRNYYRVLTWFSPVSWINYSLMGHTNQYMPSYAYGIGMTVGMGALLAVGSMLTIHKCDLETEE